MVIMPTYKISGKKYLTKNYICYTTHKLRNQYGFMSHLKKIFKDYKGKCKKIFRVVK